jgi:rsbT co-antagonist protein RsbR
MDADREPNPALKAAAMRQWLEGVRALLVQRTLTILRANVMHNRSGLPPFRLPQVAEQLIAEFGDFLAHRDEQRAVAFGGRLGQQGLGLRGLLAVNQSLIKELWQLANDTTATVMHSPESASALSVLHQFLTQLSWGLSSSELQAVTQQRNEMQGALERAINNREQELHQVILDLSTPVMPLLDQILVLPVIGKVDVERAAIITERLLAATTERRARIIIIDISGIPDSDASVAEALLRTARAVQLLGALVVLVGIRADVARELAQLNIDLTGIPTRATLQDGLQWALRELGLGILPLSPQSVKAQGRAVGLNRSPKNDH